MKIKFLILLSLYFYINSAVLHNNSDTNTMVAIQNNYKYLNITDNISVKIQLKSLENINKIISYGDTQFIGYLKDIKNLTIEPYGDRQINFGSTSLVDILNPINDKNNRGLKVISINSSYFGKYAPELFYKSIEDFIDSDSIIKLNEINLDFNISEILQPSSLNLYKYLYSPNNPNLELIRKIFPGLYYRGYGNTNISNKKIATYILNLPDNYTQENLLKNYTDIIKKWTLLKDYFRKNNKEVAVNNCDKIIDFISQLATQLDPEIEIQIKTEFDLGESTIYGDANAHLFDKVKDYFKVHHFDLDENTIIKNIIKGEIIYDDIQKGKVIDPKVTIYTDNIKNLIWFLYALAIYKNQAFDEGTFLIEDPEFKIYDYLSKFAKSRISSHYKEIPELLGSQMGVDAEGLPKDKKTLLFGKVDQNKYLTFIKPENFGVETWSDLGMHGWEFFVAQGRKQAPSIFGSDDQDTYRKERVPADLTKEYIDITTILNNLKNTDGSSCFKNIDTSKSPIHIMHKNIKTYLRQAESSNCLELSDIKQKMADFITKLEKQYDNLDIRSGREVILKLTDFNKFNYDKIKESIAKQLFTKIK